MRYPPAILDLARTSAVVGCDPMLNQGPGGNTSLKNGDRLWVKASGLWLAHACESQIFLPLRLADVLEKIERGETEDLSSCVIAAEATQGLRPSIETALHAIMPQRAVIHAHAVNSMTASVLKNGEALARVRLEGIVRWCWIPYRRPGAPLANCIRGRLRNETFDVMILQNHGVLVGAATPEQAERCLRLVEKHLGLPSRSMPAGNLDRLSAFETDHYHVCPRISGVAMDDRMLDLLTGAALVPDQAVFLGGPLPEVVSGETADAAAVRIQSETGFPPPFLVVRGAGVLGRRGRLEAAELLLRALLEIASRVPEGESTVPLSPQSVAELMDWDAEHHRQAWNRTG